MIVAIDLTTVPPGELSAATVGLVASLGRGGSPARRRVVLAREEHRQPLRHATHGLATVLTLDPPDVGRAAVNAYRRRKLDLLDDHAADLLHVAGGGPPDLLAAGRPVVLNVDGLDHRLSPGRLSEAERWHRETWWSLGTAHADAVIVPTDEVGQQLRQHLGVDGAKVFVAAGGDPLPAIVAAYAHAVRGQPTRKAA